MTPLRVVLGMDPGATGAVAAVCAEGRLQWVEDMPVIEKQVNAPLLWDAVEKQLSPEGVRAEVILSVVENVHSMPKQGVASSFKFGRSKGVLEMLCAVVGAPTELPSPTAWKKTMALGRDKERALSMAIELWPEHASLFARKKDDGRAEAALMAEWGRRLLMERGVL